MKPATLSEALHELRVRRFKNDRGADDVLLLKAEQVLKRIDDAGGEFHIANIVSQATGEGKLDVTWGDVVMQLDPVKAREIAWMLLEGASIAESEAGVIRFLKDRIGIDAERAAMVLQDFRQYRKQSPSSLVGEKGH